MGQPWRGSVPASFLREGRRERCSTDARAFPTRLSRGVCIAPAQHGSKPRAPWERAPLPALPPPSPPGEPLAQRVSRAPRRGRRARSAGEGGGERDATTGSCGTRAEHRPTWPSRLASPRLAPQRDPRAARRSPSPVPSWVLFSLFHFFPPNRALTGRPSLLQSRQTPSGLENPPAVAPPGTREQRR